MNIAGLLFLLFIQFHIGLGIIELFSLRLNNVVRYTTAIIVGVMVVSLTPFMLQLAYIPITLTNVIIIITALTIVLNIKRLWHYRQIRLTLPKFNFSTVLMYEWVFIAMYTLIMIPSVWKCFYYPPVARDMLSGPEVIAEYTIKEKTMLNSILKLNLESTNNHLKPPFVTDLQIVYKLLVHPFGQVWLTIIVLPFLFLLYHVIREKLHPLITGLLFLCFLIIPEVYSYTFIILFDYSNMIMLFLGVYFISLFITERKNNLLSFAILMLGFATSIRAETLILIGMCLPLLCYILYKQQMKFAKIAGYATLFITVPFCFYYIWIGVYLKYYMPGFFDVGKEMNKHLFDVGNFINRLNDMTFQYMYGDNSILHYGYFIIIATLLFFTDFIISRKLTQEAKLAVYVLLVLYVGIPLIGHVFPLYDLDNTTKRGLFKMFPLMLLLLRNNNLLVKLSGKITAWELEQPKEKQTMVLANARQSKKKNR